MSILRKTIRKIVENKLSEDRRATFYRLGNAQKVAAMKELHAGTYIENIINAVEQGGENGISRNDVLAATGKSSVAAIAPLVRNLEAAGIIVKKGAGAEEPAAEETPTEEPLQEQFRRLHKLTEKKNDLGITPYGDDEEEEFDLNQAFAQSPKSLPYKDVLNIVLSYESEDMVHDFQLVFPKGKPISKEAYLQFEFQYMDDRSEESYIKANWISVTDPDVYEKAGLV